MSRRAGKVEEPGIPSDVSGLKGWRRARHAGDPTRAKLPTRRVTINLDEDIVAMFKAEALLGGPPYQVAINQALRSYLHMRELTDRQRAADLVLKALENDAVIEKLRQIR